MTIYPTIVSGHDVEYVRNHLRASADLKVRLADSSAPDVVRAADTIAGALRDGGKILLCGNGGSAADCQHVAAEFVSRLTKDFERPGIPAIALTTDTSFLTAYANDIDFDGIFERQVEALGRRGDVLIGISTSGESRNVIRAVRRARAAGMFVVTLCGPGGTLTEIADVAIAVPGSNTQLIQESHLAIEHAICHIVERRLYAKPASA